MSADHHVSCGSVRLTCIRVTQGSASAHDPHVQAVHPDPGGDPHRDRHPLAERRLIGRDVAPRPVVVGFEEHVGERSPHLWPLGPVEVGLPGLGLWPRGTYYGAFGVRRPSLSNVPPLQADALKTTTPCWKELRGSPRPLLPFRAPRRRHGNRCPQGPRHDVRPQGPRGARARDTSGPTGRGTTSGQRSRPGAAGPWRLPGVPGLVPGRSRRSAALGSLRPDQPHRSS